eukprot:658354-Prymnesium_polylepis.4
MGAGHRVAQLGWQETEMRHCGYQAHWDSKNKTTADQTSRRYIRGTVGPVRAVPHVPQLGSSSSTWQPHREPRGLDLAVSTVIVDDVKANLAVNLARFGQPQRDRDRLR